MGVRLDRLENKLSNEKFILLHKRNKFFLEGGNIRPHTSNYIFSLLVGGLLILSGGLGLFFVLLYIAAELIDRTGTYDLAELGIMAFFALILILAGFLSFTEFVRRDSIPDKATHLITGTISSTYSYKGNKKICYCFKSPISDKKLCGTEYETWSCHANKHDKVVVLYASPKLHAML